MKREEAIAELKLFKGHTFIKTEEAIDIAIDALEHEEEIINALGLSLHVQSLNNSILEEEKHKLDKIRSEVEQKCYRINFLAGALPYAAYREIHELLCDIMDLFDSQERSNKE